MASSDTATSNGAFAKAFLAAQREIKAARMGGTNPHFKSKYARFADVHEAVVPVLNKHGIAVLQHADESDDLAMKVTTVLMHDSGEAFHCPVRIPLPKAANAHAAGSALTYARRYGLALATGLVNDDDDDGNASAKPAKRERYDKPAQAPKKKPITDYTEAELTELRAKFKAEGKDEYVTAIDEEFERRLAS